MSTIFTLCVILSMITTLSSNAQSVTAEEDLRNQIKLMETEIQEHELLLQSTREEYTKIEKDLQKSERSINELETEIEKIKKTIESSEQRMATLLAKKKELKGRIESQESRLSSQIQAAYRLGKQETLKLILNQKSPDKISRTLAYFDYLNEARVEEIDRFLTIIDQSDTITEQISIQAFDLEKDQRHLYDERLKLDQRKKQKNAILNSLNQYISDTDTELIKLQEDRGRIEKLLGELDKNKLSSQKISVAFKSMKGKLFLPVDGKVTQKFGTKRNIGKMQWRGLFIDAPEGEPVFAIHSGEIVFADWLRGFGLLLIINHGQGYMSLYAHNQKIYYQSGDHVLSGEQVASVGNTGGQIRSGLYFEIRIDGKPADPQTWCQAKSSRAA
ncbi:MAG: hypothetical protein CBB61_007055 [Gammaproteobacteria bacterium TMED1]|nr:MAG: hypothetical protein CBB61_007055 [Gammaproteobacteria bacterium TMED1]|tara:strand:- start:4464 stop:5624 length:1161 start_codon:yes stop_codon:yes gene_type:complete